MNRQQRLARIERLEAQDGAVQRNRLRTAFDSFTNGELEMVKRHFANDLHNFVDDPFYQEMLVDHQASFDERFVQLVGVLDVQESGQ